jgi:hypothetical protein
MDDRIPYTLAAGTWSAGGDLSPRRAQSFPKPFHQALHDAVSAGELRNEMLWLQDFERWAVQGSNLRPPACKADSEFS